jgi:folate-dependent phosphoribosylglycinamide formyltransferase PurN
LLLGKPKIPIWFGLAVEEMRAKTNVEIDDITIATTPEERESGLNELLQNLVVNFQDLIILSSLDAEVDIRLFPSISENDIEWCTAEPIGEFDVEIPEQTVERISRSVDIVIHHGVGILKGDILREPDHGVIGYHHGDIREYRGPGYGFWEYMNEENASGVTLQVLADRLDSGQIVDIVTVDIADAHTLPEIRRRVNAASVPLLATGIQKLNDPDFSPEELTEEQLGEMYYYSDATLAVKMKYLVKECLSRISRVGSW